MNNQNTSFRISLVNDKKGLNETIKMTGDEYILDIADEQGIQHPSSCRAGSCFDCLAKIIDGKVEQTGQALSFLKPDEIEEGYILLCSSCPTSDCTILTHQEEEYLA